MKTKATIIIVTHNRPNYLRRLLDYYNGYQIDYKIIVSDSSADEKKIVNKEIISSFPKLDVLYLDHYLDKIHDFRHQAVDSFNYFKTKYCVFCADDDFITPSGIKQSVDFLEKNHDFVATHGHYVFFYLKKKRNRNKQFCWHPGYSFESITHNTPEDRLYRQLSDYPVGTLYAVHRSDVLKLIFQEVSKFTNDERFAEFLLPMLALIYGKIKYLDMPYSAKELILDSAGIRNEDLQDFIKDGSYNKKYARFKECLVIHLNKNSQLGTERSKILIDGAMDDYFKKVEANDNDFEHFVINIAKYILSFFPKNVYKRTRALYIRMKLSLSSVFSKSKDNFLVSLNDPSSKYYDDFNKIKNCVLAHITL